MVAEADRLDLPLRAIVKSACLDAYGDAEQVQKPRKSAAKKKTNETSAGIEVSNAALNSADDFLDDMGF